MRFSIRRRAVDIHFYSEAEFRLLGKLLLIDVKADLGVSADFFVSFCAIFEWLADGLLRGIFADA